MIKREERDRKLDKREKDNDKEREERDRKLDKREKDNDSKRKWGGEERQKSNII